MKLSQGTLFALIVLPALAAARLQPHIKRQSSLVERAPGSTTDNGTDDCNGGHSTTKHSTISHHRHHKHHHKQDHQQQQQQQGNQPVQTTPPKKDDDATKSTPPTKKPVEQPIEQPVEKPAEQPVKQPVTPTISTPVYKGNPTKGGLLAALASNPKNHDGFFIGTAVRASYLDGSMDNCLLPHYNLLVPEYEAKSDKIEPQRAQWVTSPVDTIVGYTKKHGMAFKIHCALFDQTMAPYFQSLNGNPEGLKSAIKEHIEGLLTRYGNDAVMVDVVNEVLSYGGDGSMKKDIFYNTLGAQYLPFAFETAKAANSHPLLSLNDNDVEGFHSKGLSSKYEGLFKVVKDLKSKGVHIDMVSLECHFITGQVPKELPTVIKNFASLGVKVFLSEVDIKNDNHQDAQQAEDFAFVMDACLKNFPACRGVNFWGPTDRTNWNGEGSRATLWDGDCKSKGIDGPIKAVLSGSKTYN